jgi:DNA-binding HxlR family transcriptional regulator
MKESSPLWDVFPDGVFSANCPSRTLLEHVTSKWGVLVILSLTDGPPLRWSELRRRVQGVSDKMLAQTLRTLEADGLLHRDARPVVPPHVEYSLTDDGQRLGSLLAPLMEWIAANAEQAVGDRVGTAQAS